MHNPAACDLLQEARDLYWRISLRQLATPPRTPALFPRDRLSYLCALAMARVYRRAGNIALQRAYMRDAARMRPLG